MLKEMTEMETKKISFGFSKTIQKSVINSKPVEKETIELIKCLEGKEIKLVQEKEPKALLVIPLLENKTTTSAALASLLKRRAVLNNEDQPEAKEQDVVEKPMDSDSLSLEQRATRELLSEVKDDDSEESGNKDLVLPILKPEELPLDGAKEPSADDYEAIPVQDFGRAVLRGMGWTDPPKKDDPKNNDMPIPRPKGMGLGADKAIKSKPLLVQPDKNEVLKIKRQAFVRILGGKHKDMYGQIEGFDDHTERVIVKMAIGGAVEVFNEFMCQPVAKKEYEQYSRCINSAKYEAYKRMENEYGQIIINKESTTGKDEPKHWKEIKHEDDKRHTVKEEYESDYENNSKYKKYSHEGSEQKKYRDDEDAMVKESKSKGNKDLPDIKEHKYSQSISSRQQNDYAEQSSSSRRRKHSSDWSSDENSSDSDVSAHHRRHKSKSNKSRKSRSSRKSEKSKRRRRDLSTDSHRCSEVQQHHKSHKKKTKKSKKERSRSRSRR